MNEITLPSGATLGITLSSFEVSKDLYQVLLDEAKTLNLDAQKEIDPNLFKDMFCMAYASKRIEKCVWECLKKCTYNKNHITKDTFEPEEARQDYNSVMFEVAKANINPFLKSLYAQYSQVLGILKKDQA